MMEGVQSHWCWVRWVEGDMKQMLQYYKTMLVIRYFEEKVESLFSKGMIKGTAHPAIGQEALAVGACAGVRKGDYITSTHRGHGHFIARGGDPARMMAELFGKRTGYSGGRGGSQLMADYKMGFLGSNGITGGGIPFASGVALSCKLRKTGRVCMCFFGDGAASQGMFHESLNMAGLWDLPVVYICENNGYAMSSAVEKTVAVVDIAGRAAGYGIPGVVVDGNDLCAIREVVRNACKRARDGQGATLVECKTYRLSGHSRGDQCNYRSPDEEAQWWVKDPIKRFRKRLGDEGLLSKEDDKAIKKSARDIVRQAVAFAKASPLPDVAELREGVFV